MPHVHEPNSQPLQKSSLGEPECALLVTPSRFLRNLSSRIWNTGNGSPDAIAFSVDRSGILIAGAGIYGGVGTYDFELELLAEDVRNHSPTFLQETVHLFVVANIEH